MHNNLLRQLKDIQYQAEKLQSSNPSIIDIENFKKYSDELKVYLIKNVDLGEMNYLINEIPDIKLKDKKNELFMLAIAPKVLKTYFREKKQVKQALQKISICKSKYASIEFILKNNQ